MLERLKSKLKDLGREARARIAKHAGRDPAEAEREFDDVVADVEGRLGELFVDLEFTLDHRSNLRVARWKAITPMGFLIRIDRFGDAALDDGEGFNVAVIRCNRESPNRLMTEAVLEAGELEGVVEKCMSRLDTIRRHTGEPQRDLIDVMRHYTGWRP